MSTLYLVRHGQTEGFVHGSYTHLTDLGIRQSRALGAWFQRMDIRPDALFVGPLERQKQTLKELTGSWENPPEAQVLPDLAEHNAGAVVRAALSQWPSESGPRAELARKAVDKQMSPTEFFEFFREVMRSWSTDELCPDGAIRWDGFQTQIASALGALLSGPPAQSRVAVSSGGAIGVAVAQVLGIRDPATQLELGYAVFNTSVTEIRYSPGRRSLLKFNHTPHLGPNLPPTAV